MNRQWVCWGCILAALPLEYVYFTVQVSKREVGWEWGDAG